MMILQLARCQSALDSVAGENLPKKPLWALTVILSKCVYVFLWKLISSFKDGTGMLDLNSNRYLKILHMATQILIL